MKQKRFLAFTLTIVTLTSLSTYFVTNSSRAQTGAQPQTVAADNEYQVAAILYMQKAAEYRALCYQAFNAAKMYLDADFDKKNLKKLPKDERKMRRAIVVDIDETVLDNSPAQASAIKNRKPFNLPDWYAWGDKRSAKAIPGAVDFLNYAVSKSVKIFYVSNRDEVQKQATIDNLKSVGFQNVSSENVLLRTTEAGKEARRKSISADYRIVILAGDNLNDLSDVFERKSVDDRFAEVEKSRTLFGGKFIVLPNAMYGDWESAIYEYKRLTEAEKTAKRNSSLESY